MNIKVHYITAYSESSVLSLLLSAVTFLFTLLVCKVIRAWRCRKKDFVAIPGPKGWPLVGNSFQIDPHSTHRTFLDWSRKYGPVFKVRIFQNNTVVLNDFESIREMLTKESCASKPYIYRVHDIMLKSCKDIIFHEFSAKWMENKKILSKSLDTYIKDWMEAEDIALECVDKLVKDVQRETNQYVTAIDMGPCMYTCVAGIITGLYFGRKLSESQLTELIELMKGLAKLGSPAGIISGIDHFPWMRHLPIKGIQEPIKAAELFMRWIQERLVESKTEQSILHALMLHIDKVTKRPMTPEELTGVTHNIISAGLVTVSASLYSLILVLINHPEIQEKMHKEIQQITQGRRPHIADHPRMPYVKAVIEENFRFATVVPIGTTHVSVKDTMIRGKLIPKGTNLLANFWALLHDDEFFDEPWKFNPERFLEADGRMVSSNSSVWRHNLAFSAGSRYCPGDGLAKRRMFLIIAHLLQKYRFLPEDDHHIPSCDPRDFETGIVIIPSKYKVNIMER